MRRSIARSIARTTARTTALGTLGVALFAASGCVAAGNAEPTLTYASGREAPNISGVWQVRGYAPAIRTLDGDMPPLLPAAAAEYEVNLVDRAELPPQDDMTRCLPPGAVRVNYAPFPMMVLQTERKMTLVYEYHHILRHIYMDEALPPREELDFYYVPDSVGRWEGDTLVVETAGFNEITTLDREGMPHSENLHLTERWRLIDGGARLENTIRIDDPDTFAAPWETRVVFERRPDTELQEYNCWLRYEDY